MTYFILNTDTTKEQMAVEAQSVNAQDILFSGNKQDFESLGFNESQVGGFELINGNLTFNQELFDDAQKAKLPQAQGKDLLSEIEENLYSQIPNTLEGKTYRISLRQKLLVIAQDLTASYMNPMSQDEYLFIKGVVQSSVQLTDEEKAQIDTISNQWSTTVRFE